MHTLLKTRLSLVTTLLLGACDAVDPADAPDRGALADAVELRPWGSTASGGGSTLLNTSMLFPEGMPLRHFARNGALTSYDDAAMTKVRFMAVRLVNPTGALTTYNPAVHSISSEQGRLKIGAVEYKAGDLLGSEWVFQVSNSSLATRSITLKVTGVGIATVRGGTTVPLYNFTLDAPSSFYVAGPYSTCSPLDALSLSGVTTKPPEQIPVGTVNMFKVEYAAVLYGGVQVSSLGTVSSSDVAITAACVSGAIGKSALWGYPSWASVYEGMTGIQQLQATSRAIRADYCADGTSHTVDGTPVQIRDRYSSSFDDPTEATEAVWGGDGSQCAVIDNRLGTAIDYPCSGTVATTSCKQLGSNWITGSESFIWTKAGPAMTTYTPSHSCTSASASPGCEDSGIEATVCGVDPYCCVTAWDPTCVNEVTSLVASADACCVDNGAPGCGDAAVSACVGSVDAYCTSTRWDSLCALEVEPLGCGLCH